MNWNGARKKNSKIAIKLSYEYYSLGFMDKGLSVFLVVSIIKIFH